MAATLQQHCATNGNTTTSRPNNAAANPNPQLKRLVYSKYRELLGSYNDQANAYIDTLPSYMVHRDTGFNLELKNPEIIIETGKHNGNNNNEMYGSGQRMPGQQTYEAPACVQNAMMTKDKKPFTYTPGGIDLSQIKSERMAKRLARNAQAEGATGIQQQNRPQQPQSPGGHSPNAAATMGVAAMGMPFQVLPPPPPPAPGKNFNGGSAPPPPPQPSFSNFSNNGTLAPPSNGNSAGGRGSAPNSPSMPRKSPTPQRFEPPPMGFRPEIKIPPNPMAALRKVPTPVEKNTFWKDEYVKERSKSPMVDAPNASSISNNNTEHNDSVNSTSSLLQTTNANNNGTGTLNNDNIDGFKKAMPTTTTNNNGLQQQNQTNNNYTNYQQQQQQSPQKQQQIYTPPNPTQQPQQQSPIKPMQQSPQYGGSQPPLSSIPTQHSPRPEFRSVAAPSSPTVNVYTRQTDSPHTVENATPPRATESPFKFAQQQQQRAPPAISPLAQQSAPSSASSGASVSPNSQGQSVPWRTQRNQPQQQQQQQAHSVVAQSHPQPIYNNVQQQQQKTPEFLNQQATYQGPKPTNVGSLYIAPLAPPTEPQAQHIVRQQLQQQQQQRDSPMRQIAPQQQQQPSGAPSQQLRWMSSQPMAKEQPAWARPEENGNVVPLSLNRIKSPPPPPAQAQVQQQPQQHMYQPLNPGNGFAPPTVIQNFGAQPINTTGLRLQINTQANQTASQNGPKERIIPIQLEQTPTYAAAQPSFNTQQQQYGTGSTSPAPGYVMRTPNQFVDQGYNNFAQQQQTQPQRVMSPNLQQLSAPRMVQQTQNNVTTGNKTHIIPIALENNDGTRGPISKTPIVIQNDQRTPPIQSKSFRILQKITDTIDDGSNDDSGNQQHQQQQQQQQQQQIQSVEPQLQRPTFARQMSAQQARHSPTVEQMRRMQIGHEQGNYSAPTTPTAFIYNQQQRSFYDNSQHYIPPSEQQVPEPKKYTGSAIPSRSFKILQAMTQPENADEQENSQNNNEMNEIESEPESNRNSFASTSSTVEPVTSCSSISTNSELAFPSSTSPTSPSLQPSPYSPYPYPYGYPWYPPPPHMAGQNIDNYPPSNWQYLYGMHSATPPPSALVSSFNEHTNSTSTFYPPYPYYYPYYTPPPPPHIPPYSLNQSPSNTAGQTYDLQNMYSSYMSPPYLAYPYPIAPSYTQSSSPSRVSSVLPDIIITPSSDDVSSQALMKHHNKIEKKSRSKRQGSTENENVSSLKQKSPAPESTVVHMLTQHLQNMSKYMENNLNSKNQARKSYRKNIEQKSPDDNTSPIQVNILMTESEIDTETETSDSEVTPKQIYNNNKKGPLPLKSIKSVNNVNIYNKQKISEGIEINASSESETEEDDGNETTADGESDVFDEEEDEEHLHHHHSHDFEDSLEQEEDSDCEEIIVDDNLSVIYEEESEMDKSSDMAKTVIQGDRSSQSDDLTLEKYVASDDLNTKIEEYDEDAEKEEDSTSVTVRLPLKFSFSTTKNAENIATLEVGTSEIEEKRNNISLPEKRNSFSVATIKSDSETEDESDCDVSVTISLTNSSKSNSLEAKLENEIINQNVRKPKETLEEIESSQEDISVSFSLNMRNKFAKETINDDITNNIATMVESAKEPKNEKNKSAAEPAEELDFFATLMATKIQTQKIKEQSANYWGKSIEDKDKKQETVKESKGMKVKEKNHQAIKRKEQNTVESKEAKLNFWNKYSSQNETETLLLKEAKDESKKSKESRTKSNFTKPTQNKEDINQDNSLQSQDKLRKPTTYKENEVKETKKMLDTTFWKHYSKQAKQEEKKQEVKKIQSSLKASQKSKESTSNNENSQVIHEDKRKPKYTSQYIEDIETKCKKENVAEKHSIRVSNKYSLISEETEEVTDIWADRVDDLPPIKSIKNKLMSLESAKNFFSSSVLEAKKTSIKHEPPAELKSEKTLPLPENITRIEINENILKPLKKDILQPQIASIHYEEEVIETPLEPHQEEEIDFWAQIEKARENKSPEPKTLVEDYSYINTFEKEEPTCIDSFGEQETSMYNDDIFEVNTPEFDPLKYPEEPREVDTDEEIDFWAEIETKRLSEENDVTFHKSALFWASKERHNSVDETPFKPVLPKAFHAKLPDEPPATDINIWKSLEAHKGEEPIIIDPEVEEENFLAQQYDEMPEHNDDTVSVHEPVLASVWCPPAQEDEPKKSEVKQQPDTDFWTEAEQKQETFQEFSEPTKDLSPERDELEIKRSNYRKAMAFFNTSIDDNKEQNFERYERRKSKSKRSSYIEEESEQWDWDAVNKALQQDNISKQAESTFASNETPTKDTFDKELTPHVNIHTESIKDVTPLPEIHMEPARKPLSNDLPDLEVNKFNEERKISVKDCITAFEKPALDSRGNSLKNQSLSVDSNTRQSSLSRNSSIQKSESEMDEDDSGVTDMNKQLSETDTESESFPELRKMSSYQRASTHSRLFKLLQEDPDVIESNANSEEFQSTPSRRKIVHNVSITRKQNPQALAEAETMSQRRERLSLPLRKNTSIDADNPSTPNSPASPIIGSANKTAVISDKLVNELVQSLLLKSDSTQFRKLPMEKLQAAAKRVLEEELDSLKDTSLDSTPPMKPIDIKKERSYADYYNSWSDAQGSEDIVPSKSFRALQDTRRCSWTARCPRVLSSKTINRDLTRVTESPEISMRTSKSPECFRQTRESSIGKWRKT